MQIRNLKRVTLILVSLVLLCRCGDLVNSPPPSQPSPSQAPSQEPSSDPKDQKSQTETKKPKAKPRPPKEDRALSEQTREDEMCEREREWAYATGLIDAKELGLFRKRNFAPVYRIPGERQSGIDLWFACPAALRMNHFI